MKHFIFILTTFFLFACNEEVIQTPTPEYNYSYMYFNQYDFDGLVGTKSDIIVVSEENIRNANSRARQIADVGEFEEDFDNYVDEYGNSIIANDQYLSDHCWGRGDFSIIDKDVEGDGMDEQVLGGSIVPSGCVEVSCQPKPFASAVAYNLGLVHGDLNLGGENDNIKISGNPSSEDVLNWINESTHIAVGDKITLWADIGQTITIKDSYNSTARIRTKSGEDEVLNTGEFMVIEKSPSYDFFEVNKSTTDSIQFFSRPFNITGDISIKLEDLLVETDETVHMEIFITWENGTPYGDGNPVYTADLVDGLNIKPPDDVKGFYRVDIAIPEPVYYVRFKFVFSVVDTNGEPTNVYIDGFHVEGQSDLNTGSCEYNSLPIEITDFYAIQEGEIINLYIETATELIADYMEFYGTFDGINWITIEHQIPCDNYSTGSRYHLEFDTRSGLLTRINN